MVDPTIRTQGPIIGGGMGRLCSYSYMVCLEALASPCELRNCSAADAEIREVAVRKTGKLAHGATRFLVT